MVTVREPAAPPQQAATSDSSALGQRPLRALGRAAAIHADRFGHWRLASLLTLASADQRVIVQDGVAALTVVPSRRSLLGWVIGVVAAVAYVCAAGFIASSWATVASMAALAAAAIVLGGLALDRRFRARRWWRHVAGSWQLTDVAGVRGTGAGERLMSEVLRRADASSKQVVLSVRVRE